MKKLIVTTIIGICFLFPAPGAFTEEIKVTGDTIEIIDADIDTDIQQGKRETRAPSVFRFCIDGREFVVVRSGDSTICLQVIGKDGKPKQCVLSE